MSKKPSANRPLREQVAEPESHSRFRSSSIHLPNVYSRVARDMVSFRECEGEGHGDQEEETEEELSYSARLQIWLNAATPGRGRCSQEIDK
jgi:hypothetical protein